MKLSGLIGKGGNQKMSKCETCAYSKFDELWGEYKCIKYARRITTLELLSDLWCTYYEKDTNKGEKHDTSDDNSN